MAPRGRPKKKKVVLTRKGAAVDAMLAMGFPRKLINQTIAELLKVYGGNEGWSFIEMDSYKALIEAILEKDVSKVEECSQDYDLGGNSQRFSEAGSSNVPPPPIDEEVAAHLPPPGDGLDSGLQTETVLTPPFAVSESECNVFTSPAEEKEEGAAAAGPLDQVAKLSNSMVPCSDENPCPTLSLVEYNAFTSPAEGCEVAGPPDPDHILNDSIAPCYDEHPALTLSSPECKVLTSTAEENEVPGPPDPDPNSMVPCFDEHPVPVLSSMSDKHRPPCHGWRKRPCYDEPTKLTELEPSPLPEKLLKLLGEIRRSPKRLWDV
ncbi:unnamed protein product [Linum trigynum]|uniref:WIYLD domain-containing protein n=1 Tax=Linum trigynum TaxID=586398 RepID=A0AAV2DNA9_9ROSI